MLSVRSLRRGDPDADAPPGGLAEASSFALAEFKRESPLFRAAKLVQAGRPSRQIPSTYLVPVTRRGYQGSDTSTLCCFSGRGCSPAERVSLPPACRAHRGCLKQRGKKIRLMTNSHRSRARCAGGLGQLLPGERRLGPGTPPPPCTNWTRLVLPPVLSGYVSSFPPY